MNHILVVDDSKLNLAIVKEALEKHFIVSLVNSGEEALKYLLTNKPDLILLDLIMPVMDGYETIKLIKSTPALSSIPVIFLTAEANAEVEAKCLSLGAMDFILKPISQSTMLARINRTLELCELRNNLELEVQKKSDEVEQVILQVNTAIANIVDAKDSHTVGHSKRVANYASQIAYRLNWPRVEIHNLYFCALLHDIGKIAVPASILSKPDQLTKSEYDIIKTHTEIGDKILKDLTKIHDANIVAKYHHEWFDGNGYCNLSGDEIPLSARIVSICDAYDAMSSNRSYRSKYDKNYIINEFINGRSTQFDPKLVDIILDIIEEGVDINTNISFYEINPTDDNAFLIYNVLTEYTKEMQSVARKDSLTGVWNRTYAENMINSYLSNISLSGTFFMLDLDNFKNINDTFGHVYGDEVLKTFANILSEFTSPDDIVSRLGGDEFIIFLRDITSHNEASSLAIQLLNTIKQRFINPNDTKTISSSIGIAIAPYDGNDYLSLYRNADKALYFVKNSNKNSYHFYNENFTVIGN